MSRRRAAWCSPQLVTSQVKYALVTSAKQYAAEMRRLGVETPDRWVSLGAGATCHTLQSGGDTCCIVSIGPTEGLTGVQIASLLVHEAVHVWQVMRASIGETSPSSEFEAYAIQAISEELMTKYVELTIPK